jgi:hypothetical protein
MMNYYPIVVVSVKRVIWKFMNCLKMFNKGITNSM